MVCAVKLTPAALGIADDVESMEMKGSKKRKARQLDDIDYIPILKPIPDPETAQKVAAAMRQTLENTRVLSYLLQRIKVSRRSFTCLPKA